MLATWIVFTLAVYLTGFMATFGLCALQGASFFSGTCRLLNRPVSMSGDPMYGLLGASILFSLYTLSNLVYFLCGRGKKRGSSTVFRRPQEPEDDFVHVAPSSSSSSTMSPHGGYPPPPPAQQDRYVEIEMEEIIDRDGVKRFYTRDGGGRLVEVEVDDDDDEEEEDPVDVENPFGGNMRRGSSSVTVSSSPSYGGIHKKD